MNNFLRMVTNNRILAIALGALITAILHSSGATTVMTQKSPFYHNIPFVAFSIIIKMFVKIR